MSVDRGRPEVSNIRSKRRDQPLTDARVYSAGRQVFSRFRFRAGKQRKVAVSRKRSDMADYGFVSNLPRALFRVEGADQVPEFVVSVAYSIGSRANAFHVEFPPFGVLLQPWWL
jgi:hypothetical protein